MNDTRQYDTGRRQVLLLGAAGTGMLPLPAAAQDLPACVVTPAQTEGPYFADERLNRSDIRADPGNGPVRPGVPLTLALRVSAVSAAGCTPLAGAMVDVWHCDATGIYSGTADAPGRRFLRGYQMTGTDGAVHFTTIYPGWYPGRAVHIHFKIRARSATGLATEFTSQLYFDESVTDRIMAVQPYAGRGRRSVSNENDGLYRQGGRQLTAALAAHDRGYRGTFDIGLRL